MIPADLIVSGKNPSTRKEGDPNVSLNIEINQSNFFGYDLLNKTSTGADDFIETRDLKIKLMKVLDLMKISQERIIISSLRAEQQETHMLISYMEQKMNL